MKILYVITQADGGGAQKYVLDMAAHFGGSIAAGTEANQLFGEANKRGIKTFPLRHLKRSVSPWHDLAAIFEIKNLILQQQPDIVHLNSSKAGFLGSLAGKLAGAKVVFTAHGFFYFKNAAWPVRLVYTFLEKIASKFRFIIITVSEEDRQQALAHHLLAPDKIITIHNGIPAIPFLAQDEARKILNLPDDKIILGNVAQLYNRKAIDVLIKTVSILPPHIQAKVHAVVLGEGPDRANLAEQIKKADLDDIFTLAGYKPQAVTLLKAFDVFVLSSRREGFPYVLLEALSAGLPVIATDVGGNTEALGDAGIIVPAESPDSLATAISGLINSPAKQKELSERALQRSRQFTLDKMFAETERVYKVILGN